MQHEVHVLSIEAYYGLVHERQIVMGIGHYAYFHRSSSTDELGANLKSFLHPLRVLLDRSAVVVLVGIEDGVCRGDVRPVEESLDGGEYRFKLLCLPGYSDENAFFPLGHPSSEGRAAVGLLGVCHQAICAVDHQFDLGAHSVEVHRGSQNNGVAGLQEVVYSTHVIFEEAVLRIGVFATRLTGPYLQIVEIGFLNLSASASGAFQDLGYQKADVAPLVGASH
jgi:hypothetical protein